MRGHSHMNRIGDEPMPMRGRRAGLLVGEWACLGLTAGSPTHGFAVAARLEPAGDFGRVWSMSRALTYRSLEQLRERSLIEALGEEPGTAGGQRTILAITADGIRALDEWLATPVRHLRDYRSELLLKLLVSAELGSDPTGLLVAQKTRTEELLDALGVPSAPSSPGSAHDFVTAWRRESAVAALRFVEGALAAAAVPR